MPDAAEFMKVLKKNTLEAVEAAKPVNVLFGRVAAVEPLQIDVEQKMRLGKAQIILARNVTDFETEIFVNLDSEETAVRHRHDISVETEEGGDPPHSHGIKADMQNAEPKHSHKIKRRTKVTVYNGLAAGDEVVLLRCQGGQKYLVVDRIR